jgi:hypothetical protein
VKNNSPSGKIVLNKSANVYISANVMPIAPQRDCGFSFAALVHIPLFSNGAQRQMKKNNSSALSASGGEYNFEVAPNHG